MQPIGGELGPNNRDGGGGVHMKQWLKPAKRSVAKREEVAHNCTIL